MNKKIIIIPDVHGRTFWKEAVKGNEGKPIIFLGDYVDCYPDEGITPEDTYVNFEDIIDFAKKHSNVILLLGNHDLGYIDSNICNCRKDRERATDIANLFIENHELFKLFHTETINGHDFIFSHAGLHKIWFDGNERTLDDLKGNIFDDKDLLSNLADVSYYRGGWDAVGSPIWADIREFLNQGEEDEFETPIGTQIVGHTRCMKAFKIKEKDIYMLDAQCAFYIDENGKVRYFNDGKEIENLKL